MERIASSIRALTQSCISKFERLLAAQRPGYIGPLENRLADFSLWADGVGALAKPGASLDSRLQNRTNDLKLVKNVLMMLADSLEYLESLADADINFIEAVHNIDSVLENLALIGVAIRRTGKASRNRRANQTFNSSEHQELRKHLECIILLRPTEEGLFRRTENGNFITELDASKLSDLQQRLIQANLRRRHNFLVAQKRSIAQTTPQAQPSAAQLSLPIRSFLQKEPIAKVQDVAQFQDSTPIATSDLAIRGKNAGAPTISGYSLASTAEGTLKFDSATNRYAPGIAKTQITFIASNADFPKAPFISSDQKISKCPCCCQSIPGEIFRHPKEWKQHIIEDLCPYTCIAENCPTPHLLFCTRDEWETHVTKSHLPQWQCPFCEEQEDFPTMESMGGHLQDKHQEEFLENSFSTLLSWSAVQKMGIKSCPLCLSCGVEDSPELVNHILQHTYEFALRSLPWPQPIIHNLNVSPGGFDLSVSSSHAEELQRGDTEDVQIYNAEDVQPLTAGNLRTLKGEGIRHWTAIQLWINKEVHERKEPPELQLTNYDRADHSAPDNPELFEYSNYFLTNQYFGNESDEDKSSKPQRDRSSGDSIAVSTGTDWGVWNEAEPLEMPIITMSSSQTSSASSTILQQPQSPQQEIFEPVHQLTQSLADEGNEDPSEDVTSDDVDYSFAVVQQSFQALRRRNLKKFNREPTIEDVDQHFNNDQIVKPELRNLDKSGGEGDISFIHYLVKAPARLQERMPLIQWAIKTYPDQYLRGIDDGKPSILQTLHARNRVIGGTGDALFKFVSAYPLEVANILRKTKDGGKLSSVIIPMVRTLNDPELLRHFELSPENL
ncbi:hypothetical protein V8C40DRAFT_266904 [Trichoderma camerunense]